MNKPTRSRRAAAWWAVACSLQLWCAGSALAADRFPSKPVTLVVPFAPGGNLDLVARTLAPALEKTLGQTVVVDNRAGAGGALGAAGVARAEPDGHTLLVTTPNAVTVLPQVSKTAYQPSSFQAVGLAATTPLVVVVRSTSRFKDWPTLLAEARTNPGRLTAGHAGAATTSHVALLQMEDAAGIDLQSVPYKGAAPALVDLMGGQIDVVVDQLTSSAQHLQSGALRALAVMSRERDPAIPGVPTLRELGLSHFEATTATGLVAPAGTSRPVIETLNSALRKALSSDAVKTRLAQLGSPAAPSSDDDWQRLLSKEESRTAALVRAGKLKMD